VCTVARGVHWSGNPTAPLRDTCVELDEAANMARLTRDAKALTAAVRQKAELCGLIVRKELQIRVEKPSALAALQEARARAGRPPLVIDHQVAVPALPHVAAKDIFQD
jgi:hypothetical protein